MVKLDEKISWGNLITLVIMILTATASYARLETRADAMQEKIEKAERQTEQKSLENRELIIQSELRIINQIKQLQEDIREIRNNQINRK